MAEETKATAQAEPAADVVVVAAEPAAEKAVEKDPPLPEAEKEQKLTEEKTPEVISEPEKKPVTAEEAIPQSSSFKEESNRVSDLLDPEKKALEELKQLIQQALNNHEFTSPPPKSEEKSDLSPPQEKPAAEEPVTKESGEEAQKKESEIVEEEKSPAAADVPPETQAETPAEVVVVEETVVVAAVVVDDDGAKTVEAIEESVVSVSVPPPPPPESDPPAKEAEVEPAAVETESTPPPPPPEEVFIWGIPLLGDERSDVVLLKFLRARDFKVKEAFTMLKNTVRWRKEFGIDELLEEDLGNELEKVVFMHGFDKEGHPVCYNVYGEFANKELYQKTFSDEEKRQKFLRWRIQHLEKGIRELDFSPTGICTIVQVYDLKKFPFLGGPFLGKPNQALSVLQDNYPEFVARQILVNVPWWYLAYNRMLSPFLTQRTKSKFLYAGPSKSSETLFKYIAPEQVPVKYGGLSKENDPDFSSADAVTEITIKPADKHTVELPVSETCVLVWELRVLGWDVNYGAEFVPSAEDAYTVIVLKTRKMILSDEPFVKNSFKISEPGKVVLTIDNPTNKKKKLVYRSKIKNSSDSI